MIIFIFIKLVIFEFKKRRGFYFEFLVFIGILYFVRVWGAYFFLFFKGSGWGVIWDYVFRVVDFWVYGGGRLFMVLAGLVFIGLFRFSGSWVFLV